MRDDLRLLRRFAQDRQEVAGQAHGRTKSILEGGAPERLVHENHRSPKHKRAGTPRGGGPPATLAPPSGPCCSHVAGLAEPGTGGSKSTRIGDERPFSRPASRPGSPHQDLPPKTASFSLRSCTKR